MRIYEQIEISLSELEANHNKLTEESAVEKDKIRCLSSTVNVLENRCEELQRNLEEAESLMKQRRERRKSSLILQQQLSASSSEESCKSCGNDKEERKNSVCIQDLIAGVGVLQAEANRKHSQVEHQMLQEEVENSPAETQTSLEYQVNSDLESSVRDMEHQVSDSMIVPLEHENYFSD